LKRENALAESRAEEDKDERTRKRARAAKEAELDPQTGPVETVRERNVKEAEEGKQIERAKL
jgi:hypothetical protein